MVDVDTSAQLDSNIVLDDGNVHELTIPSGAETGLKLVQGFDVAVGGSTSLTIDFDLRKSIVNTGTKYFLRPALRLVDNSEIGHISGNVDVTTLCPVSDTDYAVYVFAGNGVSPDDTGSIDGTGADTGPLTTALLDNSFNYGVGYLNAGDYTLALTCIAGVDNPEQDDIEFGNNQGDGFVKIVNVTVVSGTTITVDLQ
jgi:hypothetical protein